MRVLGNCALTGDGPAKPETLEMTYEKNYHNSEGGCVSVDLGCNN
jgi:hypothetical protein